MSVENLRKAKVILFFALGLDLFLSLTLCICIYLNVRKLIQIQEGAVVEVPAMLSGSLVIISGLSFIATIAVGVLILKWMTSCYNFSSETIKVTGLVQQRWRIWGWFIPFLNLIKPYQVLSEIYKIGSVKHPESDRWKNSTVSSWLTTWWIFWVLSHLTIVLLHNSRTKNFPYESNALLFVINELKSDGIICLLSMILAVLWLLVIEVLTQRLLDRGEVETIPSQQELKTQVKDSSEPHNSLRSLNADQRNLLIVVGSVIFTMLLYPPYKQSGRYGQLNTVYDWLFFPPINATVDATTLLVEWFGVLIVGAIVFVLLYEKRK